MIYGSAIGGGGGLKFRVIGGATLPNSASENTVWVCTSTPINKAYVQAFEPTDPVVGDVWIYTWTSLDSDGKAIAPDATTMTISQSPFIKITAQSGYQWNGTEWAQLDTRVYKNGAWSAGALIIFGDGAWGIHGAPTKQYRTNAVNSITLEIADGVLHWYSTASTSEGSYTRRAFIEKPIDVSIYNKLSVTGHSSQNNAGVQLCDAVTTSENINVLYSCNFETSSSTDVTVVTDISSADGEMYLALYNRTASSVAKPSTYYTEIALTV